MPPKAVLLLEPSACDGQMLLGPVVVVRSYFFRENWTSSIWWQRHTRTRTSRLIRHPSPSQLPPSTSWMVSWGWPYRIRWPFSSWTFSRTIQLWWKPSIPSWPLTWPVRVTSASTSGPFWWHQSSRNCHNEMTEAGKVPVKTTNQTEALEIEVITRKREFTTWWDPPCLFLHKVLSQSSITTYFHNVVSHSSLTAYLRQITSWIGFR